MIDITMKRPPSTPLMPSVLYANFVIIMVSAPHILTQISLDHFKEVVL